MLSHRIASITFNTQQLIEENRILISNPLKKLIYEIACPKGTIHGGNIAFSRWTEIYDHSRLKFPGEFQTKVVSQEDSFSYETSEPNTDSWWVNFADDNLFIAYGGPLFAQDEIQVAEHPALASLKEALKKKCKSDASFEPLTRKNGKATPILVSGVERRVSISLDVNAAEGRPKGLYGNNFMASNEQTIRKATKVLKPPSISNIICMAALCGGRKEYCLKEIESIFNTAYTSFFAAVSETKLKNENLKVVIHTGNWGTGAFGGNRELMALIQVIAAYMARVDVLIYHTFDKSGSYSFANAQNKFEKLTKCDSPITINALLWKIYDMKFQWGFSDGN